MKLGDATRLLLLSDDGATSPIGIGCKELAPDDPAKRLPRPLVFLSATTI